MRKASLFVVLAAALVFAAAGSAITNGDPGRERPSGGRRAARDAGVLGRHVGGMHRHVDLGSRLPDRGALRPGRGQRRGDLRDALHARREPHVLGRVARRPGLQPSRAAIPMTSPSWCSRTTSLSSRASRRRACPGADSLSNLPKNQQFTPVGYGAQSVTSGAGGKTFHYQDVRYRTVGTLNTVTKTWLKLSGNSSHGDGNTCYGDSGGPNFLGAGSSETNIVAGDDDHGRHALPVDERGLPARHALGAGVPRAVRHAAVVTSRASRPQITNARLRRGSLARESPGARSTSAPSAASSSIRASGRADADVDAAAEADVLGGVRAADVEGVRVGEHPRVAVRGAEQQRDLRAARHRLAGDLDAVLEHPALEQLERRVPADQLLDRGGRLDLAGNEALPLLGVVQQRDGRRCRACSPSPRGRRSAAR